MNSCSCEMDTVLSPDQIEDKFNSMCLTDGCKSLKNSNKEDLDVGNDVDEGIVQDNRSPSKNGEVESTDMIQFNPPVYLQRYRAVQEVLAYFLKDPKHMDPVNGCTVMEVGCAEFGLHVFLKGMVELGKIIYMDIDEALLVDRKQNLRPLPAEHLMKVSRPKPLVVEAYAGDIVKIDSRLIHENPKIWGVIAIELIEHLYPQVLRGFEISVFGVLSPSVVVITTPNSDFNPIFNLPPGKFRHWDHKFEWTRQEFLSWCEKICQEFPNYTFAIEGIGNGPEGTENLGSVSQMAIFQKNEFNPLTMIYPGVVQDDAYKLLESIPYPNYIEYRTDEEIILQELRYTLNTYWFNQKNLEHYLEIEQTEVFYPLKDLQVFQNIPQKAKDIEYLKNVFISANYEVVVNNGEYMLKIPIPSWGEEPKEFSDEEMEDQPYDNSNVSDTLDESWE